MDSKEKEKVECFSIEVIPSSILKGKNVQIIFGVTMTGGTGAL